MNGLLVLVLWLTAILSLFVSVWYVSKRINTLFHIKRTKLTTILWGALFIASSAAMLGLATSSSPLLGTFYIIGGFFFIAHVYLSLAFLVVQGLTRLVQLAEWVQSMLAIGSAVVLTLVGSWMGEQLTVDTRDLSLTGLDHEVTLMHISDVHLGHHRGRSFLEHIVEESNRKRPDLVVITGDLIDGNMALDPHVLEPLSNFNAPVYFVTGNHEAYVDFERALSLIKDQGVHILRNERVVTQGLQLVGLDYMNADEDTFDMHPVGDRTIKYELPQITKTDDLPIVLLHHSPVGLEYVADYGTQLMLAGHTHAGQVFPGTLLAPLIFRLNQGLYKHEDMQVFVSPGAGTFMMRMRLGSQNRIHQITLRPE